MTTTPDEVAHRNPRVKCRATVSGSNGEVPCKNYALKGTTVCKFHGGSTKHVQKKARERLQDMVDPAISQLYRLLEKPDTSDADRIRVIQIIMDRTGYHAKSELTVEAKPWEGIAADILIDAGDLPETAVVMPSDTMAELQAQYDAEAQAMVPDAEIVPFPEPESHPVAATKGIPAHLR